jgi:hypothetical protein
LTVKVMVVLALPAAFVAVTVYVVADDVAVGVPVMVPVLVLNDKPAGNDVLIDQLVAAPPELVGVQAVIAVPTTAVLVDGL